MIDPAKSALLVMDYQSGIVGIVQHGDALVAAARRAIDAMRAAGGTVGYVRVALSEEEANAVPDGNKSFSAIRSSGRDFGVDSPATQIDERIAPEPGDIVVRKQRVGAFSTTDLDRQLRDRGIDTLILAGISTSGVVLSTVRDAADRDYRILVLSDACADPHDDVHDILMAKVFPRQADIVATRDLPALLKPLSA